ncbi:MAG: RsmD family RNA methyltransferase [Nitrososphaerota archaeon]|nr:RsmD family RNA methyltransferase [Nitrososphaerota archaeon]
MKSKSLVLLSGEGGTIPASEAKSLFSTYDPSSEFRSPAPRILVAESEADPFRVGRRIAFARRVGRLVSGASEAAELLEGHRVRFRAFDLAGGSMPADPEEYIGDLRATIDLRAPDLELTLVRGEREYLAVTSPGTMAQGWSLRRPRQRPFFHPAAIFPKLSRALVNLSRCVEGDVFLDPFAGTGSIPLEAAMVGCRVAASDVAEKMVRGAWRNMRHFRQEWLGVVRADSGRLPVTQADAVATDVPYGRASSTRGLGAEEIMARALPTLAAVARPGATVVLMHQKEVAADPGEDFVLMEEHDLHVHKRLTRTISVLRRR